MTRRGEFEIIRDILAPLAEGNPGAFGLTDDAAALRVEAGHELIATTDAIVAGVHFLADDHAANVARRLLRVNLSDLAAMGAAPLAYLIDAVLPRDVDEGWLWRFADGLRKDQGIFGLSLVGGDTVATDGPLVLALTALGQVPEGQALRRSGARAGDAVYVSGQIGDGLLGLRAAKGELDGLDAAARTRLMERFFVPEPRLALGERLRGLAHATIDVSDGLAADLGHICEASGLAAKIDTGRIPLSEPARQALVAAPGLLADLVTGGDDYELLFTTAPEMDQALRALSADLGLPITCIGQLDEGEGVRILAPDGSPLRLRDAGYRHF